jgi:peptidoglycan-associated lipoprotein
MFQSPKILPALVGIVALSMAAGCAEQASPARHDAWVPPGRDAGAAGPELAGAWYQVFFDTNSVEINPRGQMIIKNVAYVVANNSATRVTVIGKTDRAGPPSANMALSQRRANVVRDALVIAGVPAGHIDTSWTGEFKQDVATVDDTVEPRNRVVDITVVKSSR